MVRCPNCGQKTDGDYCQWCGSPISSRDSGVQRRTEQEKKTKEAEARVKKEAEEAEKRARKEAEKFAKEQEKKAREAEARAKKEAEEAEKRAKKEAEQLAREQAKKETEEEKEARVKKEAEEAEKRAKKEAEQLAKEEAKKEAGEEKKAGKSVQDIGSATYEGDFQIVLPSPLSFKHVRQFTERLEEVEDLKVMWTGGSLDEGTIIGVSVQKPVPLVRILSEMLVVEKVEMKEDKIVVTLKTSAAS